MDYALASFKNQQANLDAKLLVAIRTAHAVANPSPDGCLVCGSPNSASPHFGSVSCLACAAFFRRTVALDITFNCKGNRQCQIYYELRMICRACRYEKCLRAGMKRQCVQKRRPSKLKKEEDDEDPNNVMSPDPALAHYEMHIAGGLGGSATTVKNEPVSPEDRYPSKREKMESASEEDVVVDKKMDPLLFPLLDFQQPHSSSVESFTEEDSSFLASTSFVPSFYLPPLPQMVQLLNPPSDLITPQESANNSIGTTPPEIQPPDVFMNMSLTDVFTSNIQPPEENLPVLEMSGKQLIDHLLGLEKEAMDRRRMMFCKKPLMAFTHGDGKVPYARDTLTVHTLKEQAHAVKFDHFLGYEYAKKMPFVDNLDEKEKKMLLRFCCLGFSVLDIGYISSVVSNDTDQILVFTDGSYSTCGPDDFSVGWDTEDIITFDDKKMLFLAFNHCFHKQVICPMRSLQMDQVEHAALKAICSWKLGLLEYTTRMKSMAKTIQKKVLEGLIVHYREIGREDIEVRIGEIYLLIGTLFEMYAQVTEMYKTLDLFNLQKVDEITRGLLEV